MRSYTDPYLLRPAVHAALDRRSDMFVLSVTACHDSNPARLAHAALSLLAAARYGMQRSVTTDEQVRTEAAFSHLAAAEWLPAQHQPSPQQFIGAYSLAQSSIAKSWYDPAEHLPALVLALADMLAGTGQAHRNLDELLEMLTRGARGVLQSRTVHPGSGGYQHQRILRR